MDKTKIITDFNDNKDKIISSAVKKTDIRVYAGGTDILLFRGSNKVILPGAAFTARCHFDLPNIEVTPSYNIALGLENSVYGELPSTPEKAYLFCVGTDGCGIENSQVREVDYAKWIAPGDLVPFRYPLKAEDNVAEFKKYHGRKSIGGRVAYYFKEFESTPILVQRYDDGTPIMSNVYENNTLRSVETYVDLFLKITEDDCREFFIDTTSINDARINTISICTAWKKNIDGKDYYQDIRPLTKYNMPNESLIEMSKGLDIRYHIYY